MDVHSASPIFTHILLTFTACSPLYVDGGRWTVDKCCILHDVLWEGKFASNYVEGGQLGSPKFVGIWKGRAWDLPSSAGL